MLEKTGFGGVRDRWDCVCHEGGTPGRVVCQF